MAQSVLTTTQMADLRDLGEDVQACERDLAAGKTPCVSYQPNGREIRLVIGGFETQPADDNYWITVPSIAAAIDAFENPAKYC